MYYLDYCLLAFKEFIVVRFHDEICLILLPYCYAAAEIMDEIDKAGFQEPSPIQVAFLLSYSVPSFEYTGL